MVPKDSDAPQDGGGCIEEVCLALLSLGDDLACRVLEQKKIEHQASLDRNKELEKLALLEQKRNREDKIRQTRLITAKVPIPRIALERAHQ